MKKLTTLILVLAFIIVSTSIAFAGNVVGTTSDNEIISVSGGLRKGKLGMVTVPLLLAEDGRFCGVRSSNEDVIIGNDTMPEGVTAFANGHIWRKTVQRNNKWYPVVKGPNCRVYMHSGMLLALDEGYTIEQVADMFAQSVYTQTDSNGNVLYAAHRVVKNGTTIARVQTMDRSHFIDLVVGTWDGEEHFCLKWSNSLKDYNIRRGGSSNGGSSSGSGDSGSSGGDGGSSGGDGGSSGGSSSQPNNQHSDRTPSSSMPNNSHSSRN